MTLTRIHALAIAVGLVLIGVAVARAGTGPASLPGLEESHTFAEGYVLRDGRATGEWRHGAPQELNRDFPAAL
jgi:hypothetical protein